MKRLILVDDDPAILDVFGLIFTNPDYDVVVCRDAGHVLDLQTDFPDLILLDKQLSGSDGLEVCRKLKKNSLTKDIPVIMISATPGIQRLAIEAGAVAGIEKPFSIKDLRLLVKNTLETQQTP